eukprot:1183553-Prorocentrum_minimum.AAC.1
MALSSPTLASLTLVAWPCPPRHLHRSHIFGRIGRMARGLPQVSPSPSPPNHGIRLLLGGCAGRAIQSTPALQDTHQLAGVRLKQPLGHVGDEVDALLVAPAPHEHHQPQVRVLLQPKVLLHNRLGRRLQHNAINTNPNQNLSGPAAQRIGMSTAPSMIRNPFGFGVGNLI